MVLCKYAERVYYFIEETRKAVDPPKRNWRRVRDTLLTVGSFGLNIASVLVTGATLTVGGWLAFLWTEFKLADKRVYTMGGVTTAAIATALAVTTPGQARRLQGIFFVFNLGVVVCMLCVPVNYAANAVSALSLVKGLLGRKGWGFFLKGEFFKRMGAAFMNTSTSC
ncbi:hypothetical protein Esi_0029_0144 [Ectocarpus siliculosus]|uniref:Uncharacterized protein n=1 Tax=Ectocarpus siliculosus TaxID=2880 RepID=D7FVF7_ECTSI|nr:hypothetical protein Esi_0029_0144 [Ectocarpus siliculosus]|eukprot:CBJ26329.1 hypothetical protein Esi_0029_0144 [Ectocarpus siliculosus]